jgi:mannose/fructose/N-acetylgalactosamine-specific phosphotransferase system component IIC
MKTARISLAVVAGLLLAVGYAAGSGHDRMSVEKIIIGLMFGTFMAFNMIRHPERITRFVMGFVTVVLLALVVHEFLTATRMEAILTAVLGIAFIGVQVAFASLPADAGKASVSDSARQ